MASPSTNDKSKIMPNLLDNSFYSNYQSAEEIFSALDELMINQPDLADAFTLAASYEGRDIRSLRLRRGGAADRPQFVIDAGYHGCDWAAMATCVYLIKKFADSPLPDHCEIYFVPIVNPDGYSYTSANDRLFSKNRRASGVDLQANFAFHWGEAGDSNAPMSALYHGSEAGSEPETKAMQNFFASLPRFNGYISLAAMGQAIASPWGWTTDACPDATSQAAMIGSMTQAITKVAGKTYAAAALSSLSGKKSGNSVDYVYGVRHVRDAYQIRLRDDGCGYLTPASKIIPMAEEVYASVAAMLGQLCNNT
jgi:hypothetical protein